MTRTSKESDAARPTWRERVFVLGGFAVAALYTGVSALFGTGMEALGAVWLGAVTWAVLASLACALRRGVREGDWSAFRHRRSRDRGDLVDWTTRTGRYTYLRHREDRIVGGDRHPR